MTYADLLKSAHKQGAIAKNNGWERNSPYRRVKAERYWYAGYDGVNFIEFNKFVEESTKKNIRR